MAEGGPQTKVQETPPKKVRSFQTAQGSVYTYDNQGRTTRFKTSTGEQDHVQDITVFVELTPEQEQKFLEAYRHTSPESRDKKIYVLERQPDNTPRIVRKLEDVKDPSKLYLGIVQGGQVIGTKEATLIPTIGYQVFDTRHYQENGEWKTERHLGNKVTKIDYID